MEEKAAEPFVFVLMPFSQKFADVYAAGIKPACKDAGARCVRVDEQIFVENILEKVYSQIAAADIIVAEMTGRNPNVFYEVGYAHALNKPVILLTQRVADIPFDLKGYPFVVYGKSIATLKEQLEARIRWCIENPRAATLRPRLKQGSPVSALSESPEFQTYLQDLMIAGKRVRLSGVGLNIIQRDVFTSKLFRRAADGDCELEILLSDPHSPSVELRLIEEERGNIKPPVGREGLIRRLDSFIQLWNDFRRPDTIRIRLTTNYLTFALIVVDSDYFVYPYGYAKLGNFSPVFRFSNKEPADKEVVAFLEEHYERLLEDSVDAETAKHVRANNAAGLERLHPFAVYFVPSEDSPLYQFGSRVLGYDVRRGAPLDSPWGPLVGGASQFGFHLTLCDALYFLNDAGAKSAASEVKFLLKDFKPFDLTNLRVQGSFPDANSISLAMDEDSGSLEALHGELVHRVNRRAVASYYTAGLTKPARDHDYERARLMIKRYLSPYILQRFTPHFTLLTGVPPADQERVCREISELFEREVRERGVRVERLAVMTRPEPESPWRIQTEVAL